MTELTISADDIRSAIEGYVATYTPEASREEVGVVSETYDGIAIVEGTGERDDSDAGHCTPPA